MSSSRRSLTSLRCRFYSVRRSPIRLYHASASLQAEAPKPIIDVKHVRRNATIYERDCLERNYKALASNATRIVSLSKKCEAYERERQELREQINRRKLQLADSTSLQDEERARLTDEARQLKVKISANETELSALTAEISFLAESLPNLTNDKTPRGHEPIAVGYINERPPDRVWRSHVDIGTELNLIDFAAAATTSGYGWYILLNEAAMLEQALVQYALHVVMKRGWSIASPPSMVYSHIAAACGFQPRDQHGESQIYGIQQKQGDVGRKPEMSLAGTAEIPLAGMKANTTLMAADLPMKRVGVSRSYRREAGGRGTNSKGLYRVHEFTKVEMFAWTLPSISASNELFDEILSIQTEIIQNLVLHGRILEMPSMDLGAAAARKQDIEVWFPSRQSRNDGYGEVTSASICTDYQTRRLATRVDLRSQGGKLAFPYTLNGTAIAVPRVLAAILEYGWDETRQEVKIPEVLWPWMNGVKFISKNRG